MPEGRCICAKPTEKGAAGQDGRGIPKKPPGWAAGAGLYREGLLRKSRLLIKDKDVGLSGAGGDRGTSSLQWSHGWGVQAGWRVTPFSSPKRPCREAETGMRDGTTGAHSLSGGRGHKDRWTQGLVRGRLLYQGRTRRGVSRPLPNLEKGAAWTLEEQEDEVGTPFLPPSPSLALTYEEAETPGNRKYTGGQGEWTDRRMDKHQHVGSITKKQLICQGGSFFFLFFVFFFFFFCLFPLKKITIKLPLTQQPTDWYSNYTRGGRGRGQEGGQTS